VILTEICLKKVDIRRLAESVVASVAEPSFIC